jgi:hypothetical protein
MVLYDQSLSSTQSLDDLIVPNEYTGLFSLSPAQHVSVPSETDTPATYLMAHHVLDHRFYHEKVVKTKRHVAGLERKSVTA